MLIFCRGRRLRSKLLELKVRFLKVRPKGDTLINTAQEYLFLELFQIHRRYWDTQKASLCLVGESHLTTLSEIPTIQSFLHH